MLLKMKHIEKIRVNGDLNINKKNVLNLIKFRNEINAKNKN